MTFHSRSYLETPIEYLKGVGPAKAQLLNTELQIFKFGDLLEHFPFRYIDRTKIDKVNEIDESNQFVQLRGKLSDIHLKGQNKGKMLAATFTDDTGEIELIWFQGHQWILKTLKPNTEYLIFGKPAVFKGQLNIAHPEMELMSSGNETGGIQIQPMYPSTEKLRKKGLDGRGISKLTKVLVNGLRIQDTPETLSTGILTKYRFPSRFKSIVDIHFPATFKDLSKAQIRLKFEELFFIQLNLLNTKVHRMAYSKGFIFGKVGDQFHRFFHERLQFELTGAQKRVVKEIRKDTLSGKQMNRLLQGDVGSGKTVVSLLIMLIAIDNGFQACLMAPTEILSQQHFATIKKMLGSMDISVELLTGSVKEAGKKQILKKLADGDVDILIGTHAVIQDRVKFQNLGMVVIDEQHRFGVAQRAKLWAKNTIPPHILVMTATPIPRTLAMTVYGDLDVSVIDELPPGRKSIETRHWYDANRLKLFGFMKEQIKEGRQVYVVYPLIQGSEKMDYKDLMDGYESISRAFRLPDYRVSIVHGKMKAADKEYEMKRFVNGETHIMVATTVIEVGVDVQNATVMVIESAERFGLSQLHQLRGRVGRGGSQSFCILMSGYNLTEDGRKRLRLMTSTTDGFKLAEEDLKLRGPGDLAGTQQSGILNLKIANIIKDVKILKEARAVVSELLRGDPELNHPDHQAIKVQLKEYVKTTRKWTKIS